MPKKWHGIGALLSIFILINLGVFTTSYLIHRSHKPTPSDLEIERKLALLPLPTPTPYQTPTPLPISLETNAEHLIELLYDKEHHGNDSIRVDAAKRLGELNTQLAVDVLLEMLGDYTWFSSPDIRNACAISLGRIGDPTSIPALTTAMKSGSISAANGLALICTEEARQEIFKHFKSIQDSGNPSDQEMIETLIRHLGQFKLTESIAPLLTAVRKQNPSIAKTALNAIISIGNVSAIPELLNLINTSSPIRADMIETMERLLNKDRTYQKFLSDDFSTSAGTFRPFEQTHYQSAVIENDMLSLFESVYDKRLEVLNNQTISDDFYLEIFFKQVKGRPTAEFGFIIGQTDTARIEYRFRRLYREDSQYYGIQAVSVSNTRETVHMSHYGFPEGTNPWHQIAIRVIDSVVTLFFDSKYIGSFQSLDTTGQFGMYIIGENHLVFDNLKVQMIMGSKTIRTELENRQKPTPKPEPTRMPKQTQAKTEPKVLESIKPKEEMGDLSVHVTVKQSDLEIVILELDGNELARLRPGDMEKIKEGGIFKAATYEAYRTFKIKSGSHRLRCYVRKEDTATRGADASFTLNPEGKIVGYFKSIKKEETLEMH